MGGGSLVPAPVWGTNAWSVAVMPCSIALPGFPTWVLSSHLEADALDSPLKICMIPDEPRFSKG